MDKLVAAAEKHSTKNLVEVVRRLATNLSEDAHDVTNAALRVLEKRLLPREFEALCSELDEALDAV